VCVIFFGLGFIACSGGKTDNLASANNASKSKISDAHPKTQKLKILIPVVKDYSETLKQKYGFGSLENKQDNYFLGRNEQGTLSHYPESGTTNVTLLTVSNDSCITLILKSEAANLAKKYSKEILGIDVDSEDFSISRIITEYRNWADVMGNEGTPEIRGYKVLFQKIYNKEVKIIDAAIWIELNKCGELVSIEVANPTITEAGEEEIISTQEAVDALQDTDEIEKAEFAYIFPGKKQYKSEKLIPAILIKFKTIPGQIGKVRIINLDKDMDVRPIRSMNPDKVIGRVF